jgi:hypothetical protein
LVALVQNEFATNRQPTVLAGVEITRTMALGGTAATSKNMIMISCRRSLGLCLELFLVLIAGLQCVQAQKVEVEYDQHEDFTPFKSYSWVTEEYYQRPLLAMHIIGAVDEQLQSKNLTRVDHGGDIIVTAYGAIDSDLNVSYHPDIYVMPGLYGPVWWVQGMWIPSSSTAVYIKKGTLVVDIANPHTRQLKWRGIAYANLDPKKQKKSIDVVNKAIAKMFRRYPSSR